MIYLQCYVYEYLILYNSHNVALGTFKIVEILGHPKSQPGRRLGNARTRL